MWITAYDKPKKQDDAKFKGERLEQLKEEWLQLPSARTSGIPGLFPLVKDLPVRFTDSPDKQARERGVFKNAKGVLRGWELPPEESERLSTCGEPEVVLRHRPKRLFIEMVESTSKDLARVRGKRIYTLTVRPKVWSIDGQGNVQITRYGFTIVPDLSLIHISEPTRPY